MSAGIIASSAVIVRDADGKVYIGRRKLSKEAWPGLWETIGGGLEDDESPEACIRREIREELACEAEQITHFRDYPIGTGRVRVFVVSLKDEPHPNPEDFEECAWKSEQEIAHLKFAANCKDRLRDYFRFRRDLRQGDYL